MRNIFKSLTVFLFIIEVVSMRVMFKFGLVQLNLITFSFLCTLLVIIQVQVISQLNDNRWLNWKQVGIIIIISHIFSYGLSNGIYLYLQNEFTIHEWLLNMLGLQDLLINIGAFLFLTGQSPSTTRPIVSHMVLPGNSNSGNITNSSSGNSGGTGANNSSGGTGANNPSGATGPNNPSNGSERYWRNYRLGGPNRNIPIMPSPISKELPETDGTTETLVPGLSNTMVRMVAGEILATMWTIGEYKQNIRAGEVMIACNNNPKAYTVLSSAMQFSSMNHPPGSPEWNNKRIAYLSEREGEERQLYPRSFVVARLKSYVESND